MRKDQDTCKNCIYSGESGKGGKHDGSRATAGCSKSCPGSCVIRRSFAPWSPRCRMNPCRINSKPSLSFSVGNSSNSLPGTQTSATAKRFTIGAASSSLRPRLRRWKPGLVALMGRWPKAAANAVVRTSSPHRRGSRGSVPETQRITRSFVSIVWPWRSPFSSKAARNRGKPKNLANRGSFWKDSAVAGGEADLVQ